MRRRTGFTLVEVMVSLLLISMVMLGLLTAMRTMASSATSVEAVADRIADMTVISGFLRTTIRGVEDAGVLASGGSERFERIFIGNNRRLRWTGVMPAHHALGGLHVFELELVDGGPGAAGTSSLYLHYQPYLGAQVQLLTQNRRSHRLIDGVDSMVIAYQVQDESSEWRDSWTGPEAERILPARIRLQLRVNGRFWPEIVVPVAPL